jgi:ketosteroid isomerase-like protein
LTSDSHLPLFAVCRGRGVQRVKHFSFRREVHCLIVLGCTILKDIDAMDPALLQNIYRCYREKRLADVVALLSDDFKFTAQLPDDVDGGRRSRSRAETAILVHKFMEEYDILAFDTGPIIVTDNLASAQAQVKFRHKRTGKVLETRFIHDWRIADGKACELEQRHDLNQLKAYLRSVGDMAD